MSHSSCQHRTGTAERLSVLVRVFQKGPCQGCGTFRLRRPRQALPWQLGAVRVTAGRWSVRLPLREDSERAVFWALEILNKQGRCLGKHRSGLQLVLTRESARS